MGIPDMLFIVCCLVALLCFVVVLPIAIGYLLYRKWRKFLWLAPIIILLIVGFMFIKDLSSNNYNRSFLENVKLYYENNFGYVIYIPTIGVSLISTITFYIYAYIIKCRGSR